MATSVKQNHARTSSPAEVVANAFVNQYYSLLHKNPEMVHWFYWDVSKLCRPGMNEVMDITTTRQAINEKILSMNYDEFNEEIISVDVLESYGGGIIILVTGFLTGKENLRRNFTQCFFLAPQHNGYFVLNDVFRYVDKHGNQGFDDVRSPGPPDNESFVQELQVPEQIIVTDENVDGENVNHPENGQASIVEIAPITKVIDEIPKDSIEEPKKSHASIVMTESGTSTSTATAAVNFVANSQEQLTTVLPPPGINGSSTKVNENGNKQEHEAEGYSIFLKSLPFNATPSLLEGIFNQFGPIKSGGIQIRTRKGFCFGFVEFEVASAVQGALEASPILINGRSVVIEQKRSTNKGSNTGRLPFGRGLGYRNEGPRRPGNYGNGRSYGRSALNSKGELGCRNGNYRRDRYQRGNQNGARGGRVNQTGRLAVISAAKTTFVRAPAAA